VGDGWFNLSKKAMDRFSHPQNVGIIENPDAIGYLGDPSRGVDLELYINVNNGIITNAKFKAFGCAATIATISMASEMLKGKSIEQALDISENDIAKALDGLPTTKMYCAKLGCELIKVTVDDFLQKKG
jgi:nitrogen fixation NifU-like protein